MRNKREDETYSQYLQLLVDEIIDHGSYYAVIAKANDFGSGQVGVEIQMVQHNFPANQVHSVLQNAAVTMANKFLKNQKPVNIIIDDEGGK